MGGGGAVGGGYSQVMPCVPLDAYSQCFYINRTQHIVERALLPPATCTQKSLSRRDHKGCFSTLPLEYERKLYSYLKILNHL